MLQNIKTLLEIVAILAAGTWAYCRFLKGRLFDHKLDIELAGEFFSVEGKMHVLARICIKNSGFTRISFQNDICVLRVYVPKTRTKQSFTDAIEWHRTATIPILVDKWIEPSETIHEEHLLFVADHENVVARLEVSVSNTESLWRASTVTVNTG